MSKLPGLPITVALLGNPNTGKSTLFSALAGVHQRTGNYPGVTVEKKIGRVTLGEVAFDLIDLPGTYSLAARSPDEMVTVDVLLGRQVGTQPPDVVLCIVDASNLVRNLYLVSQVLELQRPTILALNMLDVARDHGITIDVERLAAKLGIPIVPIQANRGVGIEALKQAIVTAAATRGDAAPLARRSPLPEEIQAALDQLESRAQSRSEGSVPRYLLERLLFDTGYLDQSSVSGVTPALRADIEAQRQQLTTAGQPLAMVETTARYRWIGEVTAESLQRESVRRITWTDRIDRVLTHWLWGSAIFVVVVLAMFLAVFVVADWLAGGLEAAQGWLGDQVAGLLPSGALQSLIVDGVIAGVGGVLVFLPQICILFLLIGVLEDCGYMARAAYLMDRIMSRVGLSGKSFIPLLSSFACAVPGIMATRVIENRRDRLVTILIAPLMSCSARLPVYALLVQTFIPGVLWQVVTVAVMYFVGVAAAVVVALLLKRTLLPGEAPPFVLELPSYKLPDPRAVLLRVIERGWSFVYRAGTLILAVSIVVWALGYYPRSVEISEGPFVAQRDALSDQLEVARRDVNLDEARIAALEEQIAGIDHQVAGAHMRQSYLGRMGQAIEPVVRPLGWDWRIGCAVIASFPARELVVGTLSVIYNLGDDASSDTLGNVLRNARWDGTDRPVFTLPVGLSIMVFFALCAQCVSTLVVIRRETGGWQWPLFCFVYMTGLAYVAAWITYQVGQYWSGP